MKSMEDLEKKLRRVPVKLNADIDEAVFTDLSNRLISSNGIRIAFQGVMPTLGKLAVASVLIVAEYLSHPGSRYSETSCQVSSCFDTIGTD